MLESDEGFAALKESSALKRNKTNVNSNKDDNFHGKYLPCFYLWLLYRKTRELRRGKVFVYLSSFLSPSPLEGQWSSNFSFVYFIFCRSLRRNYLMIFFALVRQRNYDEKLFCSLARFSLVWGEIFIFWHESFLRSRCTTKHYERQWGELLGPVGGRASAYRPDHRAREREKVFNCISEHRSGRGR